MANEEEDGVQKKKKKANNNDEQTRKNNREKAGEKHEENSSGSDRKMLALSSPIRDNGQVCSRQIASNTLPLTGICKRLCVSSEANHLIEHLIPSLNSLRGQKWFSN